MPKDAGVYVLEGVADLTPPPLWKQLSREDDQTLEAAHAEGRLAPLYGPEFVWRGFLAILDKIQQAGLDCNEIGSIEIALSYPRQLCAMEEAQVEEDFKERLNQADLRKLFPDTLRIRCRPSNAASASGMVPLNDAIASILEDGHEKALVLAGGNTKGTNPARSRLSVEEITEIFTSLISPLDKQLTGATMLKLAAVTLARAYQMDFDLVVALKKHIWEQRLSVHEGFLAGRVSAHVSTHPDRILDRTIWEPLKLIELAPQSMGYAAVLLGKHPEKERGIRILGAGAGVDFTSIRRRPNLLASQAIQDAMSIARQQACIGDFQQLWLFEAHNPFPAVILSELQEILSWRGLEKPVSQAILEDDVGALRQPLLVNPAGGALAGHPIAPTCVRLLVQAAQRLSLGRDENEPPSGVSYGAVSAVGGHHSFDGFFLLAEGASDALEGHPSGLAAFDHQSLNDWIKKDKLQEKQPLDKAPGRLSLVYISKTRGRREERDYFGLALTEDGYHIPCSAPPNVFLQLLERNYVGLPIWVDERLQIQSFGEAASSKEQTK